MNLRKTTSLVVLFSFVLLILSSVVLYIMPQGRVAYWSNWTLWGLSKDAWGALHINLGILFVISGLIHAALNGKAIVSYMKTRAKAVRVFSVDFSAALLITAVVTVGTLFELPPVHGIQTVGERVKESGAEKYGEPPYGHAELSSLTSFCKRTDIDLKSALEKLAAAGVACESSARTIKEIALSNQLSPQQVYEIIKPAPVLDGGRLVLPERPAPGFGLQTIHEMCEMYGLDEHKMVSGLRFLGKKVSADQPIRQVAEANGMDPFELFEVIKSLAIPSE